MWKRGGDYKVLSATNNTSWHDCVSRSPSLPHIPPPLFDDSQGSNFKDTGSSILAAFDKWVVEGAGGAPGWSKEPVNHEGVRVNIDQGQRGDGAPAAGWALLRASLHDPLLVLNIESDVSGGECGCVGQQKGGRGV